MNIFSLMTFTSFLIYFFLGMFIFNLDKTSRLNKTFLVLSISLAIWALAYTFIYPAYNKNTALKLMVLASFGIFYVPGIMLHFSLILTHPGQRIPKWWHMILMYLPGLAMHICYFVRGYVTVKDLLWTPMGWVEVVNPQSFWFWFMNIYFFSFTLLSFLIIFFWGKSAVKPRFKKQAFIIDTTLFLTVFFSFMSDIVFPSIHQYVVPSIAPVFFIIMAFGMWVAIHRYRFMVLTPNIAAEEIISKLNELLFLVNPQGQIIMANPFSEKLLGYPLQSLVGKTMSSIICQESIGEDILKNNKVQYGNNAHWEARFRTLKGEEIPMRLNSAPVYDKAGEFIGLVVVGLDLRIMQQLKVLGKEKSLNDLKTQFITIASHEFRTPLSTIMLSVDTLEKHYDKMNAEKRREYYEHVHTAIVRMTSLLDDVLTLEKTSSGVIQFKPSLIDLTDYCEHVVEEFRIKLKENQKLIFRVFGKVPENIPADKKLLDNILGNLLSNAIKYSPPPSEIKLFLEVDVNEIHFVVEDNGIGIPGKDRDKILEAFHRASNVGQITGTGLGLNIVKNSVLLHGGYLEIESVEGQGSKFTVTIPFLKKFDKG